MHNTSQNQYHTPAFEHFWDEMKRCLATFEQPYQHDHQLAPAMELLRKGAEDGDPALMFLWAEFLFWGTFTNDSDWGIRASLEDMSSDVELYKTTELYFSYGDNYSSSTQFLLENPDEEDEIWSSGAYEWYVKSANAGYVPAICWLAWCAKRGIGMHADNEKMNHWLELIKQFPPVSDLIPPECNLFADMANAQGDLASILDLSEDIATDQGTPVPCPTWRDLFGASLVTYRLGCMLGSPRCALPRFEYQAYDYDSCESWERHRMCVEKRMWQIWCGLNGIGVPKATPEKLQSWLTDIDRAIYYYTDTFPKYRMQLDEETDKMILTLREAVQQRLA